MLYDHRKIGREMGLFHIQEEAAGSVFWHPRGYALYRNIENYIRMKQLQYGYDEVKSPQLYDVSLWKKSGHWDHFKENMYSLEDSNFSLKPMNCPGHIQIFNSDSISYKQLPMRLAEFGCCHRNEPSGSLHGIMRVRQFVQDDAHIFCMEDQIQSEALAFCKMLQEVYSDFGFDNLKVALSLRPDNRAGNDADWDLAEQALEEAVKQAGFEYILQPGEGAFYGPKLEFALIDQGGREWQCGTIQLDFVLAGRLGAKYVAQDGSHKIPVILHRAVLGSLERFIGILLEHYGKDLPVWLLKDQFAVLPIKPAVNDFSYILAGDINSYGFNAEIDDSESPLGDKIKKHYHVPNLIIIGERELKNNQVVWRKHDGSQEVIDLNIFHEKMKNLKNPIKK